MEGCYAVYQNVDDNIRNEKIFDINKLTISSKFSYINNNHIVEKKENPNHSTTQGISSVLEIESSLDSNTLIQLEHGCLIGLKDADINNDCFNKANFGASGIINSDGTTYSLFDYTKGEHFMYLFKVHKHVLFIEDGKWGQTCTTEMDGHSFTYHLNGPDAEHEGAYFDEALLNFYVYTETEIKY